MAKVNEEKVVILGCEINKEQKPKMYAWGKSNLDTLEKSIKRMMEEKGVKNLYGAMTTLEKNQNFEELLFITGYN